MPSSILALLAVSGTHLMDDMTSSCGGTTLGQEGENKITWRQRRLRCWLSRNQHLPFFALNYKLSRILYSDNIVRYIRGGVYAHIANEMILRTKEQSSNKHSPAAGGRPAGKADERWDAVVGRRLWLPRSCSFATALE